MSLTFKYFRSPHLYSTYTEEKRLCRFCHESLAGFEGPFFGEDEVDFICEPCLAQGKLATVDCTTNEPNVLELVEQIIKKNPLQTREIVETRAQELSHELMVRTPGISTWQDWMWPACCGDYCEFVKTAGTADINEIAPDGNGFKLARATVFAEFSQPDCEMIWNSLRPYSVDEDYEAWSPEVYLFQCLECGEYRLEWDCD